MLKEILHRLDALEANGKAGNPLDDLEIELKGDAEKTDESNFVEPAVELEEKAKKDVLDAIASMKPIIAKLPSATRDQAATTLAGILRRQMKDKATGVTYGSIAQNRRAQDSRMDQRAIELNYNKFNPHNKEGK